MLKWYADMYALSPRQLTQTALRRLKILLFLSIPAALTMVLFPIWIGSVDGAKFDFGGFGPVLTISLLVSFICLLILCFSRFTNRFWAPSKYLDEWERDLKHKAMSFAAQVFCWSAGFVMIGVMLLETVGVLPEHFTIEHAHLVEWVIGLTMFILIPILFLSLSYMLWAVKPVDQEDLDVAINEPNIKWPAILFMSVIFITAMIAGYLSAH